MDDPTSQTNQVPAQPLVTNPSLPVTPTPVINPASLAPLPPPELSPASLRRSQRVWRIIKIVLIVALVFAGAYAILSYQVPVAQLTYEVTKPTPNPPGVTMAQATTVTGVSDTPMLNIPKINVHAPIVFDPGTDEAGFERSLEHGVAHYAGTAMPGDVGNTVIFGHSSNDWWQPGDYKFIFVLLDKLVVGDQIGIDYQSKRHYYVVTDISVVDPTDTAVMNPTSVPYLTLITCTPPGTSYKRLVVRAREANPAPKPVVAAATPAPVPAAASPILPTPAPTLAVRPTRLADSSGFMSNINNVFEAIREWFNPPAPKAE